MIHLPNGLRFIERRIVSQPQDRFPDRRENLIVVIVTNVERQIAIDALERTRPDQTTRPTRANALFDRVFSEMLDDVSRAAARNLRFEIPARFPQTSHMS